MRLLSLAIIALVVSLMGACASINPGVISSDPGWFVSEGWGSDDVLYCYPPHYKVSRYAGKCFTIN
ncbi:MAG: hypothetical protein ACPGU1_17785 [Myxococcota bacterium]